MLGTFTLGTVSMSKVPLLPNVITAFGLSCGLFVIFKVCMMAPGPGSYYELTPVVAILLLASFADVLDGAVARAMRQQSAFGGIFDSLADAISFGVAPAVIVLKSLFIRAGTELSILVTIAAMVYSVCGVLRLVRYSTVSSQEPEPPPTVEVKKKNFFGLPIPAAAAAVVSANLFMVSPEFRYFLVISEEARAFVMIVVMVLLGYLMISHLRFPAFKVLEVRVSSFPLVLLTAMSAVLLFYGILYHFAVGLCALAWSYVLVSVTLNLLRRFGGQRFAHLSDFDPEEHEFS